MKKLLLLFGLCLVLAVPAGADPTSSAIEVGGVDAPSGYDVLVMWDLTSELGTFMPVRNAQSIDLDLNIGDLDDQFYHVEGAEYRHADRMVIRTTQRTGSLPFSINYLNTEPIWTPDQENPGEFSLETGTPLLSAIQIHYLTSGTLDWSYDRATEERFLFADYGTDAALTEVATVRLEDQPLYLELWGVSDPEGDEDTTPVLFGIIDEDTTSLNLGTIIAKSEDTKWLALFNFGTSSVMTGPPDLRPDGHYFPLLESEGPTELTLANSGKEVPPAVGLLLETIPGISEADGSYTLPLLYDSVSRDIQLDFVWARLFMDEGELGPQGGIPDMDASDLTGIDDDIDEVLSLQDMGELLQPETDFQFRQSADPGNFIVLASMDIGIPEPGGYVALPMVLEIPFYGGEIDRYDGEIGQQIEDAARDLDDPTQLASLLRRYLTVTKEWTTGEAATFRLDDATYRDAFDLVVEPAESGPPLIWLTVRIILVNGGVAGSYDVATVDGATYLVIYDGVADDRFADPLLVRAETPSSNGSSGGCSVGIAPAGLLLLLPLVQALRKVH